MQRLTRSQRLKRFLWLMFSLLILGIILVWSYIGYLQSPADKNGTPQSFAIAPGESVSGIADKLQDQGLIKSSLIFKIIYKLEGSKVIVEAGDYQLSPSMSVTEIIHSLSGGSEDKKITLVEGWRVEEMAARLNANLGLNAQEFIKLAKPKEGYLFPDTYNFDPKVTNEQVITTLENNFKQKFTQDLQDKIRSKGLTPEEGVILASIVEREARSDQVRTEVASILLRRINEDMGLNADATLQYILGYQKSEQSWWKKGLTNDDKLIDSPYNTYLYRGLPPAPICNPSLSSLNAVANANPNTPYLYYIHDSKGDTYYGRNLEEHNANVQKYLR